VIEWFLKLFQPTVKQPRRVKFVEGTEWLCPDCGTTIAIANRDIHHWDVARSSDWDVKDSGFWSRMHCGRHVFKYGDGGKVLLLSPTGWVG